ncbi:MAG: hypothetical protein ACP5KJ_02270 [Candidatus Micrarchaeia archaeon]
MRYVSSKGFIISLEPALSLLMLLILVMLINSYAYLHYNQHNEVISKMHQADLWLVNDSIHYYGDDPELSVKYEWLRQRLNT